MAANFNLTAQINLRGPSNLKPIVANIRRQLGTVNSDINLNINSKAIKSIDSATNRLNAMNRVLVDVRSNAASLNQCFRDLASSLGAVQASSNTTSTSVAKTSQNVEKAASKIKVARTEMEEFGRQAALAIRRFAAFSVVTSGVFALTNAITGAFKAFIDFDRELVRLQQVTGSGTIGVRVLQNEITNLATSLGVSSAALTEVTTTLAQAGLNIEETRIALVALAKTELAPSFENLTKTTEGAIAAIRQFGLEAGELEAALGSINAVAAAYAVESGDIIAAIQRTGGVFASASKGVSEGTDALNEFIAIFTSVRQTTRESAETIATGLRTIFTRIQRSSTIELLKQFGVQLQDVEGKFVGSFEAIRRLSEELNQLDPRDIRFSSIVEELGGFRQIGKVIPLIQQFAVAQEALGVAQRCQSSLTDAQIKAQQSLANQIVKVREQFLALIRDIGQSSVFQGFFKIVLGLTSGLISLASAFKPILPILAVIGAIKGVSAIGQFATGFFGGLKRGGGAGGTGQNIGESLSGAKEKQRAEATAKAADAIKLNTDALKTLTSAVQSLDRTIRSRGSSTLSGGGKVLGFNRGGVVPGSGKGDKVPAMLEPGEVVISNQAAQKYGRGNLVRMNKFAEGGKLFKSNKKYGMLVAQEGNPPDVPPGKEFSTNLDGSRITAGIRISGFKKTKEFDKATKAIDNSIDTVESDLAKSLKLPSLTSSITEKAKKATANAKGFMFENYVLTAGGLSDPGNRVFDIVEPTEKLKEFTTAPIQGLTDVKLGNNEKQRASVINKAYRTVPQDFKEISTGEIVQKFAEGSPGGIRVPSGKGRGKIGARGARSKFKELTQEEIFQLSTKDLIAYAKAQAYDIFTTGGAGIVTGNEFIEVPQERIVPELESELTTYLGKRGFWREKISPFASEQKIKASVDRKMDPRTLRKMIATAGGVDSSGLENVPMDVLLKYAEQAPRAPKEVLEATIARYQKDPSTKGDFLKRFEQSAKNGEFISGKPLLDEIPDVPERLIAFRKSLEQELSETQDEKLRKSILDKIVKANNAIQEAKDYEKDILPTVTGRASHFAWAMRQSIPESKNFANGGLVQKFAEGGVTGVYDSDKLVGSTKQTILGAILDSGKPYDVLHGPAGSGKTTMAQEMYGDNFVLSASDIDKYTEFLLLSGAGITKSGDFSPGLMKIFNGARKITTLDPDAERLTNQRNKRLEDALLGNIRDTRSVNQLQGTINAPGSVASEVMKRFGSKTKVLQQYENGSVGGVESIEELLTGQELYEWLQTLGTPQNVRGLVGGNNFIDSEIAKTKVKSAKPVTHKDIFTKNFLLSDRVEPYRKTIQDLLTIADNNKKKPRIFTEQEKANAAQVGLVGMFPFDVDQLLYEEIGDKIVAIRMKSLTKDKALVVDQMRKDIDTVIGRGTQALYGDPGKDLDDPTKEALGLGNLEGYMIEAILARAGANPGKLNDRSVDYASGLGNAASLFGIDPNIPTEVKRDVKGGLSKARANFRNYFAKLAFGGKADGPGFEEVRQAIIDKYPEIQFRISKRKRGFGYNLMGALKSAGGLSGDTSLNFQQPTNLKQLQEYSDKLASKLMNPQELVKGGKAGLPDVNTIGGQLAKEYNFGAAGKDWPIVLRIPLKKRQEELKKAYGGTVSRYSSGGTVPAMVSNGEAFVPPKVAKKIGYAKLNKMNQADRNGMGKYSGGGGISTFKGPGSDTSDSIGPIGLPTGSYVIRAKATKALGLNKGGSVGVQRFAAGGLPFDRSALTGIETALELEAKALGISVSDLAKELKKTADETRKAALAAGKTKAEANKAAREAAGQKIDLTTLYQSDFGFLEQRIQERPEKQARVKAAERDNISGGDILETAKEQRKRVKEQYAAQSRGYTRQEAYDAGVVRPDYQSSGPGRGGTSAAVKVDLATEALVAPIKKEIANRYNKVYADEKAAIKAFYQERVNKALAAGEEITPIVNEAKSVIAQTKADLKAAAESEIATATTQAKTTVQEQGARRLDPFYDAKQAAEASAAGVPGMPKVNPQIAQEQSDYLRFKAEQAGMSVGGYKYSMAQKLGQSRFNVERETVLARTETRASATGRRRELQGINIQESLKADTQEGRRVQSIVDEFAANLQKADPSLGAGKAREAAIALAEGLSDGSKSVEEIIAANETLKTTLDGNIDSSKIMEEAFRRTALEMGESVENLKANVSNRQIEQQAFIQSTEGKRFGALSEFAPGLTERFSKTRIGRGLGAGADFISGKGGRLSKAFAGAGGFTGIGAGIAGGAEALKQFLPKSVTSDPNTAGALGALGGAGSGAAIGAQLGSFAGPIGTLIGGVGGAIIGGIQGFFSAKNQAILTNALENTAKASGNLDEAFKKLETDSSKVNFENAQKAFGDVLNAGKDIENLAFSKTGFENLGSTLTGGVDKLSAGFAEGDVGKIVLGGLQTAFGASGLGLITDYFSAPSEAQRTEAIGAMVGGSAQRNEAAARLAETGLQSKSTEELGAIFDNIKTGTGELNPITEQYIQGALKAAEAANGVRDLTAAQTEAITAQAKERAALDAYMKKRKESGATDEQIAKEISSNRAAAKKEGEEAIRVQGEAAAKQALLARATKEVAIATEGLLDVYRRINAEAQRYSDELDKFSADVMATVAGLGGDTSMREVSRQNEQVLGNVSAYSIEEVQAAANQTAGLLGGTPEAQNLANQAVGQKIVQDQIPAILKTAGQGADAQDNAIEQIRAQLESQGISGAAIDTVLTDLKNELAKGEGLSEAELGDVVNKAFAATGKGLEALQNVAKKYNDTLAQARKLQEAYNKAILEANSYTRKATQVRLNAELDLAKALGRSPTLEELNKPFDVEVASLTSGLVESGDLAAGAAGDPMAIADALIANQRRRDELQQTSTDLKTAAQNIPAGEAGDPLRAQLNSEQMRNIEAMGSLSVAAAEGRQALEKLANDGTKAASALAKIQEEQQAIEGFANFAQQVFTAEPQQLAEMEIKAVALNAAQAAGPEFMESRFNRQQAYAGLEQAKQFLTPQEYRDIQADLFLKSSQATGQTEFNVAGKQFTAEEMAERIRGGISEQDPNVIAFREATEVQAKANEALGKLNVQQAMLIQDSMKGLEVFLTDKFPDILANAVTSAREDAETKPPVKAKEEPQKPSYAETRVEEGKKKEAEGRKLLAEAKKEEENLGYWAGSKEVGAVNTKKRKAQEMIAAGQQTVTQFTPIAEKDKEIRAAQTKEAEEAKKKAETEAKARQTEEKKAKAEDAIDRAIKTREGDRPVMVGEGGQRVVQQTSLSRPIDPARAAYGRSDLARTTETPIQAPPAPGTTSRQRAELGQSGPAVDTFIQKRTQEEVKERQLSIQSKTDTKAQKEKEIAQKENRLKAATIAAVSAGTLKDKGGEIINPNVLAAQEAVNMAKQDLVSINEQITAEKQRLAALAGQVQLETQGPPTSSAVANPAVPTTPQDPNALRLPTIQTAPIPVTAPRQVSYTNQQATSTTTQTTPTPTEASVINISPESLKGLETFNTTFATYVDKLVAFEFPTIPEVIEMKGNHVVDVRISGAAAFEGLKKDFEKMMQSEIKKAMGKIWDKTNGALGSDPNR
jgi:hypothetical protein